jgi:CubicO group peptidase (beta-lactamase class C family)
MHLVRKELLQALSSGVLIFFLIITGCVNQGRDSDEIPIEGAVYSVHRSDGSQKTYIDVVIGHRFTGTLPDDISSITVSGPDGKLSLDMDDFNYNPQWRAFWSVRPGFPEVGTYTFKVTSGKKSGQAVDTQSIVTTIPLPDTRTFHPANWETVTCMSPPFSWQKMNSDRPLFYQVEIRDLNRNHIYRTHYVRDMESVRLPPDTLKSNKTYQWRVKVADGADGLSMNNRSQSSWVSFSTNKDLDICTYRYHPPEYIDGSWEVSTLEEQGVDPQKISELMHQILSNSLKNIHSILLIKNGKLILEEYFSGYHRNLKHPVASVTKSFTSTLIGIAKDRDENIALDGELTTYLPEYKDVLSNNGKSEITLEHLLTMRAGLEWNEMHAPTSFKEMIESSDAVKYVLTQKMVNTPGEHFFYNSGLSVVLGRILKNTTGSDAIQYAEEHLFAPLGIVDYFWGKTRDGSVSSGGALYLRPRDMAKLGHLFLENGIWNGRQIVSEKWVRESIYPHVTGDLISGTGYGYQWWSGTTRIGDRDIDVFYAAGHGGQYIVQIPRLDVIIVITSEVDNNTGDFRAAGVLENYIIPAVLKTDPLEEIPPFNVERYRHITGKYRWPKAKLNLKISIDNGKLYGETILFDGKFELLPVEKGRFRCFSKDIGAFWLDMIEDSKGNIEGMKIVVGFSNLPFKRTRELYFGF